MNIMASVCEDALSYIVITNNIISSVSPGLLQLTEFDESYFIDKNLDDIFKLLRINADELNLKDDITFYLFSKSLNVYEIYISIETSTLPEEKIVYFTKVYNTTIDERFPTIYQLCKDNMINIALYSAPDLILLKASQRFIDYFNEPFNFRENAFGKCILEILPHFAGSNVETRIMDVIQTGKSVELDEILSSNINGDVAYWNILLVPILQDHRVKFITSIAFDVTDRVLERHKKEKVEGSLQKSYANLIEAQHLAKMGSWEWDIVTREIKWSDEMYQIFNIDKDAVKGRLGDAISKVVHPEDLGVFEIGNNPSITEKIPFEYRIITPDGSIRNIRAKTGDILFDNTGKPVYLIGVVQDITEQKAAQKAQLEAEEEKRKSLQREIDMKDEFLSLISHEFKTPITVINSAIQTMEVICKPELSDKAVNFLHMIKQNANRQLKLVNNIMEVTAMKAGYVNVHKKNIDIVQLTRSISESIKTFAVQKDISLSFFSTMQKKIIGIDEEKYERILLNLLSNAIKYTHRGNGVSVKLSQKNCNGKSKICLQVSDDGIGIPSEKINTIFDRFVQVDSPLTRQAEGTGIGLYLVKKYVELLLGEITVESDEGVGSTFTILLPCDKFKEVPAIYTDNESKDDRIVQAMSIEFSDVYLY